MKQQRQLLQAIANKGYTLVELLMVLAIIGVLAKIAIPAYADYRENARAKMAVQDIAMMSVRIKMYWDDMRAYPGSLADIGLAGKLDPWDRPYVYLNLSANSSRGAARKDRNLTPLNSDFDLYSKAKMGNQIRRYLRLTAVMMYFVQMMENLLI